MHLSMPDGDSPTLENSDVSVPVLAEKSRPAPKLHYLHSYSFVFESPNWPSNLLLTTVVMLIPLVGPIVMAGYQYELVEALHRNPKGVYPDFDFARFGDYLTRGVWAFLVSMMKQMVLGMAYGVLYFISFIVVAITANIAGQSSSGQPNGQVIGIAIMIVAPLAIFALIALGMALRFFTQPLVLRASLSQDASQLFNLGFMRDFIRLTWREMLLEQLWLAVTTPLILVLGLLVFCIGVYPAWAWVCFADAQTNWQLYEIYLARGGEPIPLKEFSRPVLATPAKYYPPPPEQKFP